MKLAVNYTPQAAALVDEGRIEFDLYKCPDWPEVIVEAQLQRPAYVHFPIRVGSGKIDEVDWQKVETLLEQTSTRYVNAHLAPHSDDFPGMPLDTQDFEWTEKVIESILTDIQVLVNHFGVEQIILENVPWDPDPKFSIPRPVIEPDVVHRIVTESGCGLLLDTAHAYIAALHLQMNSIDYVSRLPVNKLREVHITGTMFDAEAGYWRDHFAMTADDWALAQHVLYNVGYGQWALPDIVALEYGGVGPLFDWRSDPVVIANDVPRLYQLVYPDSRPLYQPAANSTLNYE